MGGIVFCDVAVSGVGVCGACVGGLKFCVWAVFELDTYMRYLWIFWLGLTDSKNQIQIYNLVMRKAGLSSMRLVELLFVVMLVVLVLVVGSFMSEL